MTGDRPQPTVFKLSRPPEIRELSPSSRKDRLDFGHDGVGVEQHEVVERDGLESGDCRGAEMCDRRRRRRERNRDANKKGEARDANAERTPRTKIDLFRDSS